MRRKRNLIPMPHIKPILQLIFSGMNRFRRLGLKAIEPKTSNSKKFYKRSTFVTHLPIPFRYSPTHAWARKSLPITGGSA